MVGKVLGAMIHRLEGDVRRINHALKVYGFAHALGGMENVTDEQQLIIDLAAVLHDIGIKEAERKYGSTAGPYQELEGPPIAEAILTACGIESVIRERVCFLVGHHHSYTEIDGLDFQILVEADFLVNIFEDDIRAAAVQTIRDKYFKTKSGISTLIGMYQNLTF